MAGLEEEFFKRARRELSEPLLKWFKDNPVAAEPTTGVAALFREATQQLRRLVSTTRLREQLRIIIGRLHGEAAQIVLGDSISAFDAAIMRSLVERQMEYLNVFLRDLPGLSRADALARVQQYAVPAWQTGSVVEAIRLNLPTRPGDPRLACKGFCKCHLEIRRLPTRYEIFWIVDMAAEHCEDCLFLSETWNPLVIERPNNARQAA